MRPHKDHIIGIIDDAISGEVVLPEFQRSFIWDRQSIEELLVSILNDYFIGTLLILDVDPTNPPFGPRFIEGINGRHPHPRKMVLDGQQRLTSIYYALYGPDISLKNTSFPYRFLLDLNRALDGDLEDAVFSWPTYWSKTEEHFNGRAVQYEENIVSFRELRSWQTWDSWKDGYRDFHQERGDYDAETAQRVSALGRSFLNYQVALVELPQQTPMETVVEVFERINRTGEPLSVFELLTARLWPHDINLRDLWHATRERRRRIDDEESEKGEQYPKFILQVIALLRGHECTRKDLILLDAEGFDEDWDLAATTVEKALERLRSTGAGGYGVIPKISLPYSTMVPPLAFLLHQIESRHRADPSALRKLHRWYWSSLFRERYGGSTDTLIFRDCRELLAWFEDDDLVPEAILVDTSQFQRDLVDVVRVGAVYKGALSLIALAGAQDLYSGDSIELNVLDDHHIFPVDYLKKQQIEADTRNTILNRTLISSDTNRNFIRAQAPSDYLAQMEDRHGVQGTKQILETHFINDRAYQAMKENNYEEFLRSRKRELSHEIIRRCLDGS